MKRSIATFVAAVPKLLPALLSWGRRTMAADRAVVGDCRGPGGVLIQQGSIATRDHPASDRHQRSASVLDRQCDDSAAARAIANATALGTFAWSVLVGATRMLS